MRAYTGALYPEYLTYKLWRAAKVAQEALVLGRVFQKIFSRPDDPADCA